MLKKQNRLLTNFEFRITHRYGKKTSGKYFYLYYLDRSKRNLSEAKKPTRIGFLTSKKLAKNAVTRNRIKRVFREVVRLNLDKIKPGFWIALHPKKQSLTASYEEINTDFIKTLQKVSFAKEL
ncbi:ribonuclease P protein component [candidate division WWE3 bacterium]|nr:ribonuclease P protein component [candidate division WWE3 bacterium]